MTRNDEVKDLQKRYPLGTRIKLIHMDDPYTSLKPGDTGTINGIDDLGTLQMEWDNGPTLGLIPGEDKFEKLESRGKAVFVRKAVGLKDLKEEACSGAKPEPFVIEKVIELESEEYQAFSENLLSDYQFISDNLELMRKDSKGVYHCLLIKEKDGKEAILTESDGFGYSRYSAVYKENE